MVGAITVLVAIVAIFLSYNANQGLPFVPVYRVSVEVPNASRLIESNEVRIGGHRVGVVEAMTAVPKGSTPKGRRGLTHRSRRGGARRPQARPVGPAAAAGLDLPRPLPLDLRAQVRRDRPRHRRAGARGLRLRRVDDGGVCKLPVNLETFSERDPGDRPQRLLPAAGRVRRPRQRRRRGDAREPARGPGRARLRVRRTRDRASTPRSRRRRAARGPRAGRAHARRPLDPAGAIRAIARAHRERRWRRSRLELAQGFANAADRARGDLARPGGGRRRRSPNAAPLLGDGRPRLARARALLADTAELARRLEPGTRDLVPTLPVLNDALEVGTPVRRRAAVDRARAAPGRSPSCGGWSTGRRPGSSSSACATPSTRRCRSAAHVAPAQTVCNYWNYTFTFLAEHLSLRSTTGFTQRNIITQHAGPDPGPISIGGTPVDFPVDRAKAPLAGYSGLPADGLAGDPSAARTASSSRASCRSATRPSTRPHGQLTEEYPDCATGPVRLPARRAAAAGPALPRAGDRRRRLPGLARADDRATSSATARRVLRDTRVASRAPTTWGVKPMRGMRRAQAAELG